MNSIANLLLCSLRYQDFYNLPDGAFLVSTIWRRHFHIPDSHFKCLAYLLPFTEDKNDLALDAMEKIDVVRIKLSPLPPHKPPDLWYQCHISRFSLFQQQKFPCSCLRPTFSWTLGIILCLYTTRILPFLRFLIFLSLSTPTMIKKITLMLIPNTYIVMFILCQELFS